MRRTGNLELRGAGAYAGLTPQPRRYARPLQYGAEALRFSKSELGESFSHAKYMMNECVAAFAERLRAHSGALGAADGVEWLVSPSPEPYEEAVAAMEKRAAAIFEGVASELVWLLEHPPLYTAGTSAKPSGLLDPGRFPVHRAGRGGQYTYHGPGQLVAYVLLDLNKRGRDVRLHVRRLEGWIIAALAGYGIEGERRDGRPGIWVRSGGRDEKIAAIGVRVSRWVTYHGASINVRPDLSHFAGIVPCGIEDAGVTSIAKLGALA
jgi:lipoyl(octanoyl) transferase